MNGSSKAYPRVKRYKQRLSLEREAMYLAKEWPAKYKGLNAHQWAAVKRWWIYYARRRQERELGFPIGRPAPRHWVGPQERAKKASKPSVNLGLVKHLT